MYLDDMPPWGFGSMHAVTVSEPDFDPVKELYKIASEVTGKKIEYDKPERKIGFY